MPVIHDMIEIIHSDRPRWKSDEPGIIKTWDRAFTKIDSAILLAAAHRFIAHQRGNPNVQKLWIEITAIQKEQEASKPAKKEPWQVDVGEALQEVATRQADLERYGDPIRGYLVRYGKAEPTPREREVLGWARGYPCRRDPFAPKVVQSA